MHWHENKVTMPSRSQIHGAKVSRQTPLHPADSLERALDDMRQSVMAHGDEGLIMRVLTLQFRLALVSLIDTLIDLLAAFRAGRFPPLPAVDDSPEPRSPDRPGASSASATRHETPSGRGTASRGRPAPGTAGARTPHDPEADAPEQRAAQGARHGAPRSPGPPPAPPAPPIRHRDRAPRRVAGYPSAVPWSRCRRIGGRGAAPTHA